MDQAAFEKFLQDLVVAAQTHPRPSRERQMALGQLVNSLTLSKRLCRPQSGKFPASVYGEIYAEALQDLFLFVCQNIEKYDSSRGSVLAWINMLLERRFFNQAIPKVLDNTEVTNWTLADLDKFVPPSQFPSLIEQLEALIDADPGDRFRLAHIRDCPEANFKRLMQLRLRGSSWEDIAKEFGLSISTLSSFFYRSINRFSAQLRAHCAEL